MGLLLLLVGVLAVMSGGFKLRHKRRAGPAFPKLAVAEIAAGTVVVLGAGLGLASTRLLAWSTVVGTLALILISSFTHVRRALRHQRKRAKTEGERLRSYLLP